MPVVAARIEQPREARRDRVNAREIRTLGTIAKRTCQARIGQTQLSLVLSWPDVINMMQNAHTSLRNATIFTPMIGPIYYLSAK